MIFDSIVADVPVLKSAVVTLDVLITQVVWGWMIAMNMWAKSISTGVFIVGVYMMRRFPESKSFYKLAIPVVGLIFLGITLLFTVLDLHQPFRAFYIFLYAHFTSAITWGAWFINLYGLVLVLCFYAVATKNEKLYEKMILPGLAIALITTIYTAGLMGLSVARDSWIAPVEFVQMILAAIMAGSAIFLLMSFRFSNEQKDTLATVLQYSALIVAYLLPSVILYFAQKRAIRKLYAVASIMAIIGLWMIKYIWLIMPQMMPLS